MHFQISISSYIRFQLLGVVLILLLQASAHADGYDDDADRPLSRPRRIINGEDAFSNHHPYVVSIQAKLSNDLYSRLFGGVEHFCGGTLIASRWILTAAHCFYAYTDNGTRISLSNPKLWHIRMATEKLKPSVMDRVKGYLHRLFNMIFGYVKTQPFYHVEKILLHPGYKEVTLENDVALIKLKERVVIRRMESLDTLDLPRESVVGGDWPRAGQNCTALGWGSSCLSCPPEMHLKAIKIPVIDGDECRKLYRVQINLTDASEFCAGYRNRNTGICSGDSGGPLVCNFAGKRVLAGVTSAIHAKKPESYPAVFTRVVRYTDWILEVMKKH